MELFHTISRALWSGPPCTNLNVIAIQVITSEEFLFGTTDACLSSFFIRRAPKKPVIGRGIHMGVGQVHGYQQVGGMV